MTHADSAVSIYNMIQNGGGGDYKEFKFTAADSTELGIDP